MTFYLGKQLPSAGGQAQRLLYNPADLNTHAIVTGMTGSGKTGLCLTLMEEAALQGIPALLLDPKGDLTNLLLHFPNLAPQDFAPWLDAESLRRQGKSLEQASSETAAQWKKGLEEAEIGPERLRALNESVQYAVFTPGSDAGLPVSVLTSLQSPGLPWEGNRELLRERISSSVTALLNLVGYSNIDPLRSREHILLANIFERAWSQNAPLDLTELILQAQNPPFEKLGAFPLETFFPAKDRAALAMSLNNILASPAFQSWREGQPLSIPDLLFTAEGKPRHSVFYLAHLSEGERMFFVTLLLSAFETWMRTQAGSNTLRALLYFDELFGYLPPAANPPSKTLLLRLLKQARAFGVGLVLASQNPVDVDYKALSNAGSWFIGKLQTERDKERLLDGLQSASPEMDRAAYARLITGLGKRVFLLHNIHAAQPVLFQTRWAMNFLAGPLTRAQLPALNRLAGAVGASPDQAASAKSVSQTAENAAPAAEISFSLPAASAPEPAAPAETLPGSFTRPALPPGIHETFLPLNLSVSEAFRAQGEAAPVSARVEAVLYRACLLAAARARITERRYGVDSELLRSALVRGLEKRGLMNWDEFPARGLRLETLEETPAPQARFELPDGAFLDAKRLALLQRDFLDWAYRGAAVTARANDALKVYAGPDVSAAEFRRACAEAARQGRDRELNKTLLSLQRQEQTLNNRIARAERSLRLEQAEFENRKREENATHAENLFGLFTGKGSMRKVSSSLTKRRLSEQSRAEINEGNETLGSLSEQLAALQANRQQITAETNERWAQTANDVREVTVSARKTDVFLEYFGAAWEPFYLVSDGASLRELPAFGDE